MDRKKNLLPDFANPPVVETVLGVEFSPLEKWGIPHYGLFWREIRSDYPRFEIKQPLRTLGVPKGIAPPPQATVLELVDVPEVRCWFIDESETRLLQLQQDRLIINWRKRPGAQGSGYPRYDHNREIFEQEWARFNDFLKKEGLESPVLQLCEVSYVNHIERGDAWRSYADLHEVFPMLAPPNKDSFFSAPEAIALTSHYRMREGDGQVTIQVQPAIRHEDMKQVVQLTLSVRRRLESSEASHLLDWFDTSHEWAAIAFREITSDRARDLWKGNR